MSEEYANRSSLNTEASVQYPSLQPLQTRPAGDRTNSLTKMRPRSKSLMKRQGYEYYGANMSPSKTQSYIPLNWTGAKFSFRPATARDGENDPAQSTASYPKLSKPATHGLENETKTSTPTGNSGATVSISKLPRKAEFKASSIPVRLNSQTGGLPHTDGKAKPNVLQRSNTNPGPVRRPSILRKTFEHRRGRKKTVTMHDTITYHDFVPDLHDLVERKAHWGEIRAARDKLCTQLNTADRLVEKGTNGGESEEDVHTDEGYNADGEETPAASTFPTNARDSQKHMQKHKQMPTSIKGRPRSTTMSDTGYNPSDLNEWKKVKDLALVLAAEVIQITDQLESSG